MYLDVRILLVVSIVILGVILRRNLGYVSFVSSLVVILDLYILLRNLGYAFLSFEEPIQRTVLIPFNHLMKYI